MMTRESIGRWCTCLVTVNITTTTVACTVAGDCWNGVDIAKTAATSAADTVAADLGMQCGGGPA